MSNLCNMSYSTNQESRETEWAAPRATGNTPLGREAERPFQKSKDACRDTAVEFGCTGDAVPDLAISILFSTDVSFSSNVQLSTVCM